MERKINCSEQPVESEENDENRNPGWFSPRKKDDQKNNQPG
jgi:hypothetical protein